jgi:signal transduction histidine kinase
VLGASQRPEKLLAVARDITQQRMVELLREEEDRMTLLRGDIASVIAHGGEIQPLLEEIAATVVRRLDAGGARIWLLDAASNVLELQASAGVAPVNGPASRIKVGDLAIGRIATSKEPVICHDVAAEPDLCDATWMKREGITSFVGYPLLTESAQVLGVVAIFAREKIELHIQRSVRFAAEIIARFVQRQRTETERARLLQEATEARAEVELLNEIGKKIAAELDIQKLTQAVTDAATKLAKAEFGAFFYHFTDDKGESYSLHALSGVTREAFGALSLPRGTLELASPIAGRGALRSGDITADARLGAQVQRAFASSTLPIKSCLAVPVTARSGEAIGGLLFGHSKPDMFAEREERVVMNLAAQAAIAMDNARLVDQLERKVLERTARLQETISELQAFSYTVSHDLRAPLRAMQSYAQVLLEDCADRLTEPGREYLSRIENAGVRLDRLIQDVLTYSRISRSQVNSKPIDLEKLLRDIMEQYPMLRAPAAEIRIEGSLPTVLAEESSVTQCLSNLLGNAVKFVPAGRKPQVIVRAESIGDRTRVWIEDNGIGIDTKDQDRIFKMFERVEHAGRYEGTGIGLAIVRKAIERMGGQVGVESEPGKGSRFWLEFKTAVPVGAS